MNIKKNQIEIKLESEKKPLLKSSLILTSYTPDARTFSKGPADKYNEYPEGATGQQSKGESISSIHGHQ